jgi:hypothetical protein
MWAGAARRLPTFEPRGDRRRRSGPTLDRGYLAEN